MKELNLGKDKINKLILAFSIPCVISMLINSVYNIVDQIFIGKGVGTLGNAATNVIFPLIIIFNATAGLIGNGAAANLSLRLGEGKKKEASKSIGQAITLTLLISVLLAILSYIFLPQLVYLFGCTKNVYKYAVDYGRIIILGAPFMITYSSLSSIIRADGSPKYSMIMLVIGAILNIILDPIFIFIFNLGVKGGAIATVIGQIVSFIIAIAYIKKIKSVKLEKEDFKINKDVKKILALGLSSFITQSIVLILFVFMNNVMTRYGKLSKFGSDIPLSVYGVISKINSLFISTVLGTSIGVQPIVGFNYGAGNELRVKETLRKVLTINFIVGIFFNVLFVLFPKQIAGIFISKTDSNYKLFLEFAVLMCHSFLLVCSLNALEMTTSITIQSLGKVKKSTLVTFIRQIILLIPISLLLASVFKKGIYGILYAGLISDILCFIITIFIFRSEYCKLGKEKEQISAKEPTSDYQDIKNIESSQRPFTKVITISREYGSGGRYVAKLLAERLNIPCYDAELIRLTAEESGFAKEFVAKNDQTRNNYYLTDNQIFEAETKVIKKLAKNPCIIVGRCADYILKNQKNAVKIFLYSDEKSKEKRVTKYYKIPAEKVQKQITKINKERAKHYKFYTNRNWQSIDNYDIMLNVDKYGVEQTAKNIEELLREESNQ
ncbi:MAG: MATE family efflux transporter [Bacilli bacterium]|nr:MATE family efflux transporter [Bacilli bacterium]